MVHHIDAREQAVSVKIKEYSHLLVCMLTPMFSYRLLDLDVDLDNNILYMVFEFVNEDLRSYMRHLNVNQIYNPCIPKVFITKSRVSSCA